MDERRKDLRFRAVLLRASLLLDDGSQPLAVKDVSKGGICFMHGAVLPRGELRRIRLMLELGENRFSEPLDLALRVVWATDLGEQVQIGGAFVELDATQVRRLGDVLYLLTRDVAEDENGRPAFRTGLVAAVDVGEGDPSAHG